MPLREAPGRAAEESLSDVPVNYAGANAGSCREALVFRCQTPKAVLNKKRATRFYPCRSLSSVGAQHAVPGELAWLLARHPPRANGRDTLTTPPFRAEFRASFLLAVSERRGAQSRPRTRIPYSDMSPQCRLYPDTRNLSWMFHSTTGACQRRLGPRSFSSFGVNFGQGA